MNYNSKYIFKYSMAYGFEKPSSFKQKNIKDGSRLADNGYRMRDLLLIISDWLF